MKSERSRASAPRPASRTARATVLAWVVGARQALAPRLAASAVAAALGLGAASAIVFTGQSATAKSEYDSPYGYDRTWNAAVRLVRVDMGLKLIEKDDANGYLLFEYRSTESGSKVTSGSFEFIRPSDPRSFDVKVVVQLPDMPRYHEMVLVDHLTKKMRDEYGEPPMRRDLPPVAPDAGAEAGTDESN
jgi:hypothetical protein